MHFPPLLSLLSLAAFSTCQNTSVTELPDPPAPALTFLYTSYVNCQNGLYTSPGPRGIRTAIPIIGGNFTGPRLKGAQSIPLRSPFSIPQISDNPSLIQGTILPLGADWGLTDPATGIFSADTRYNLHTDDGADIFIQTSGPAQPGGGLQLRVLFETGDREYYWLNNVVAVGLLSNVEGGTDDDEGDNDTFWLKIDVWHLTNENDETRFINGTM